jgi:hypothetical protein
VPTTPNPPGQWQLPSRPGPPFDAEASAERLRDRLTLYLVLLVGLVIVSQLQLPFRLAGILLALATAWVGVQLLILLSARRRAGLGARGWLLVCVGLGLAAVLLLLLVAEAIYYPLVSDLEHCRSQADTQVEQQACERTTKDRMNDLINRLDGPSSKP